MTNKKTSPADLKSELELTAALCQTNSSNLGGLNTDFLRQSISILEPRKPVCVKEDCTIEAVLSLLRQNKVGCVLVTDKGGRLSGIFSERDCVLKITGNEAEFSARKVVEFMTSQPVTQPPDGTIAYALNLMSQGGFRHIPLVDQDHMPIGIISVKDVVDYLVRTYVDALLSFDVS